MSATGLFNENYMALIDYLGGVGHSAVFAMLILPGFSSTFTLLELFCQVLEKLKNYNNKSLIFLSKVLCFS